MTDRVLIMSCALGDVYLDTREPNDNPLVHFLLVGGDRELEFGGPRYHHGILLPGGKFTAKGFLETYIQASESWGVQRTLKVNGRAMHSVIDIGTWRFTPKSVEMAREALK